MGRLRIRPSHWPRTEGRRKEIRTMVEVTLEQTVGERVEIREGKRCFETEPLNLVQTQIEIVRKMLPIVTGRNINVREIRADLDR